MTDSQLPYSQSLALVIGINQYANPLMTPLASAPEADARAISDALADHGFRVQTLIGHEASKHHILSALDNLTECGAEDRIMVYFSGHTSIAFDAVGVEMASLSAADTEISDVRTAISLSEFIGFAERAQAKHIAFLFDTPFSASALHIQYTLNEATPEEMIAQRAVQVISAGENGRTISGVVLGGLRAKGGRLGDVDLYTFSDLAVYTQQRIQHEWAGKYAVAFGHLHGSQGGEMILHAPPEGFQRGFSAGVTPVNYAASAEKTVTGRRTDIFSREDIVKLQQEAIARGILQPDTPIIEEAPQPPLSSVPVWVIPVGVIVMIVLIVIVVVQVIR